MMIARRFQPGTERSVPMAERIADRMYLARLLAEYAVERQELADREAA